VVRCRAARQHPFPHTRADFFLLVLQYPPALCTDGAFKCPTAPTTTTWTLHGLWPERADGSYPQDCTNQQFDPAAIAPLVPEMDVVWPSLTGPNPTFWSHEFTKHGTCAEDVLPTEFDFFNRTLAIRRAHDITPALAAAGITPSASQHFSRAQFDAATVAAFGYNVLPACDSKGALTGAVVCIGKNFSAVDCGTVSYGSCKAQSLLLLPPP
jgi:ribonuclease T2